MVLTMFDQKKKKTKNEDDTRKKCEILNENLHVIISSKLSLRMDTMQP